MKRAIALLMVVGLCVSGIQSTAVAQSYGTDIHNTANPASGAMAGVSLARPQDTPSAIFGNPSTLSDFRGTQFTLGATWSEPTYRLSHNGMVTGMPFAGKSTSQGCLLPTVGVTQDLAAIDLPATIGVGMTALSGVSEQMTAEMGSMGTHAEFLVLGANFGVGVDVTERLALGASATIADSYIGAGFVHNTATVHDYAVRGTVGFDFEVTCNTTLGAYYQTKLPFGFKNVLLYSDATLPPGQPPSIMLDLDLEQPENVGLGLANTSLMNGDLLLACDVMYKAWNGTAYWGDYYRDQWVFALGSQLTRGCWKFRVGYAYADNPIDPNPGATINGMPFGQPVVEYFQATQAGIISTHRVSAGVGVEGILPGVSLDLFAGGMLPTSHDYGIHTSQTLEVWYAGGGVTWKFGQTSCE